MKTTNPAAAHSPLPFSVIERGPATRYVLTDAQEVPVAITFGQDAQKADAELIARAVNSHADLLAALEAAVEYLDANRPKGKVRDIFALLNQHENGVMKPARAAIAKARS